MQHENKYYTFLWNNMKRPFWRYRKLRINCIGSFYVKVWKQKGCSITLPWKKLKNNFVCNWHTNPFIYYKTFYFLLTKEPFDSKITLKGKKKVNRPKKIFYTSVCLLLKDSPAIHFQELCNFGCRRWSYEICDNAL